MNNVNSDLKIRERSPRGEGDQLREVLLETATEMLAETENVEEISVRAITARAGVSPTALYLHFDSKEALVRAVSERCFAELGAALHGAEAAAGDDPRAQLLAMGHAYLGFAREQPGHYAVLFQRHLPRSAADTSGDEPKIGMDVFEIVVNAVARAGVPAETAFDEAVLHWMALHGRASVASAMPNFPFPDEDRYLELLVDRALGSSSR
jgi:AcrR family transcriptional regulator